MGERFRSWAVTHPGSRRTHNQDCYVDRPQIGLWAVADGAGGHTAGDVAARRIADTLEAMAVDHPGCASLVQVRLAIAQAHAALRQEAAQRGPGVVMASTVLVLLAQDQDFCCLWAGDSRAYLLRGGMLRQVTRDHSLVQELLEAGTIGPDEVENHPRANVITRAVGVETEEIALDTAGDRLLPGDRFLLCSDGLSKTLPAHELARVLGSTDGAPAQALIDAALAMHASDNVTAVVVEFLG
jgi:serine/threonine protein phosphatase Stp1